MNMLSSQVDELREAARQFEDYQNGEITRMLREAADTIESLRERKCEQVLTDCFDGLLPPFTAHCGACGAEWGFTPKYCHNCGARVTGTRDERKEADA